MPPEGKQPLWFHLLDGDLERWAFVFPLGIRDFGLNRHTVAPGANGPSNFTPNRPLNSAESDSARLVSGGAQALGVAAARPGIRYRATNATPRQRVSRPD